MCKSYQTKKVFNIYGKKIRREEDFKFDSDIRLTKIDEKILDNKIKELNTLINDIEDHLKRFSFVNEMSFFSKDSKKAHYILRSRRNDLTNIKGMLRSLKFDLLNLRADKYICHINDIYHTSNNIKKYILEALYTKNEAYKNSGIDEDAKYLLRQINKILFFKF